MFKLDQELTGTVIGTLKFEQIVIIGSVSKNSKANFNIFNSLFHNRSTHGRKSKGCTLVEKLLLQPQYIYIIRCTVVTTFPEQGQEDRYCPYKLSGQDHPHLYGLNARPPQPIERDFIHYLCCSHLTNAIWCCRFFDVFRLENHFYWKKNLWKVIITT